MTNREFREVLEDRTARYAVDVFKFLRSLPYDVSVKIISYQLGKSASSIGANYHEANRAESRDDFVHKISIALKEANESLYWFKVLSGLCEGNEEIERLSNETKELRNVLQSILRSAKAKPTPSLPTPSLPTPPLPHSQLPHSQLLHSPT
jgi:four helix bundle protein